MSALPPIEDIRQRIEHVRFVPIADIGAFHLEDRWSDACKLHRNLRSDFHDSIGGKLKIAARVVGVLGKEDEQPVLPEWHARARIRPDGAPRQEE